jgi:hypothetical protein
VLGWKEYVDFPTWGISRVKVKIDTGARTSALGVQSYELISEGGSLIAQLRFAPRRKHPAKVVLVRAPVLRMVGVRNSAGMHEQRPLVETEVRLGPVTRRILFTVTYRPGLLFPALLGRKALEGIFVVDVSRKYLWKTKRADS